MWRELDRKTCEIWPFHTPMSTSEVSAAPMFRQFSLRPDGSQFSHMLTFPVGGESAAPLDI